MDNNTIFDRAVLEAKIAGLLMAKINIAEYEKADPYSTGIDAIFDIQLRLQAEIDGIQDQLDSMESFERSMEAAEALIEV